jgi:electron transport complex protein RnfB
LNGRKAVSAFEDCKEREQVEMDLEVYRRLARQLDTLPIGFPATQSGVELELLAKIFTPEEAAIAVLMGSVPEPADAIAVRASVPGNAVESNLREMARRGLIRVGMEEGQACFSLLPFVVGIYERQLPRMDAELARLFDQYYRETRGGSVIQDAPPVHRVIPVEEAIPVDIEILPHEWASRLVQESRSWAVRDCVCRTQQQLLGQGCDHPLEVCLVFAPVEGAFDHSDVDRLLTTEEALLILRQAADAGLVHTVYNFRDGLHHICNCCTCACMFLRAVAEFGRFTGIARSAFRSVVEDVLCIGCGECIERCPFGALSAQDQVCVVESMRCMGCGLCAAVCPTGALRLERLREAEMPLLPLDRRAWAEQRLSGRGKSAVSPSRGDQSV